MSASNKAPRIAVVGAGLVGARHARILAGRGMLAAVADPSPAGAAVAGELGVRCFEGVEALLAQSGPDGVIVATPNQRHVADGLPCIAAGIPVLVEKPLAGDLAGAERLVTAARDADVALLVGHHRRYNPLVAAAEAEIVSGRLGRVVAVNALCWVRKPDDYFDANWRMEPGAGPVFINLIHDVELLLHLCGDVAEVQAMDSSAIREFAVEDTAAILLRFRSGALGTLGVSDAVAAPWSWELTAAENPAYPATGASAYAIGGTRGSLSIPDLGLWDSDGEPGWHVPMRRQALAFDAEDPLVAQIAHFAEVAKGRAEPKVTGEDGLRALRVLDAIGRSARSGRVVALS